MPEKPKPEEPLSEAETARRRDETLAQLGRMKPQPRKGREPKPAPKA
jgi:hypothetical protein